MTGCTPVSDSGLERRFHEAMLDVYRLAKKLHRYNATYFLRMVTERGGLRAAQDLLASAEVPAGLMKLAELNALDISMEALVLREPRQRLFTPAELVVAKERLQQLGFKSDGTPAAPGAG